MRLILTNQKALFQSLWIQCLINEITTKIYATLVSSTLMSLIFWEANQNAFLESNENIPFNLCIKMYRW